MVSDMENCQHGNFAPVETLSILPNSQAGIERHKCVVCAYQGGLRMGIQSTHLSDIPEFPIKCKHGKTAPEYLLLGLPESQAGTGRHKCAICAFHGGYKFGMELWKNDPAIEKPSPSLATVSIVQVEMPVFGANPFLGNKKTFKARVKIDQEKIDAERKDLGLIGEQLVVEYEKKLLRRSRLNDLASKIIHTSVIEGDGAGYDILSYTPSGEKKFIEVKTTTGLVGAPFYMSANEVKFSKQNSQNYYLYRVFELKQKERLGKFFLFQGDVTEQFHFNPVVFQVAR
jgi:hypothetical protein